MFLSQTASYIFIMVITVVKKKSTTNYSMLPIFHMSRIFA